MRFEKANEPPHINVISVCPNLNSQPPEASLASCFSLPQSYALSLMGTFQLTGLRTPANVWQKLQPILLLCIVEFNLYPITDKRCLHKYTNRLITDTNQMDYLDWLHLGICNCTRSQSLLMDSYVISPSCRYSGKRKKKQMKKERFKRHYIAMIVTSEQHIKTLSAFIFHQYIVIVTFQYPWCTSCIAYFIINI